MARQISLKNSQNSKLPTILFGIFACTFSETAFLEIAVCLTRTVLDCEQSLFSQSSLSSAGLDAIYRAVIQSFLTACVQFRRYVAKLSMNSTANGSSGSWNSLNFFALKIGGTVTYCLIIIVSLVANSLIVIIVCKTPNLKKPINYFIANMASSDFLYPIFVIPWRLSNLHTNYSFLIGGQLGQALCKLVPFFSNVSIVMLTQNLILIAVDRFGAVLFPLRLPLIRTKLCFFFILAMWMFAIVFISKDLFAFELVEYPDGARCVRRWKKVFGESSSFASLLLAYNILFTYIPVLLLVIPYWLQKYVYFILNISEVKNQSESYTRLSSWSLPCEQSFLSCMAFNCVYEARVAFQSRSSFVLYSPLKISHRLFRRKDDNIPQI